MTQTNSNTNARKGKHLTDGERYQIQILLKEGYYHRHIGQCKFQVQVSHLVSKNFMIFLSLI